MQTYTYRVYVSDALYWQGQSKTLNKRWVELIEKKPVDTRTPDEIAALEATKAVVQFKE